MNADSCDKAGSLARRRSRRIRTVSGGSKKHWCQDRRVRQRAGFPLLKRRKGCGDHAAVRGIKNYNDTRQVLRLLRHLLVTLIEQKFCVFEPRLAAPVSFALSSIFCTEMIFTFLFRSGAQSPGKVAVSSRVTRNRSAAGVSEAAAGTSVSACRRASQRLLRQIQPRDKPEMRT